MSLTTPDKTPKKDAKRICALCPTDISHKSASAEYCDECRSLKDKEHTRESNRRARGYYDQKICKYCGEEWIRGSDDVVRWTGVCSKCREEKYDKRRQCLDCDEWLELGTKKKRCDPCNLIHRRNYSANWRDKKRRLAEEAEKEKVPQNV